jgi:hypothetical protein
MAPRVIKRREQDPPADDVEVQPVSQKRRPDLGRFKLQVDRQTKASYESSEAAETAGMAIKKNHPVVQVAIYDTVESVSKILELA